MTNRWTSARFSFLGLTAQHPSNKKRKTQGHLSQTNVLRELYQGCRCEATKLATLGSKSPTGRGLGQAFGLGEGAELAPWRSCVQLLRFHLLTSAFQSQ